MAERDVVGVGKGVGRERFHASYDMASTFGVGVGKDLRASDNRVRDGDQRCFGVECAGCGDRLSRMF